MAILKHVAGKSADYGAALDYLKYEHDEVLKKPLLDANGNWVLRRDILLEGINCEPELFDVECEMLNAQYHKNQNYDEIKTHHYLISFDPADKDECGLTGERAQAIGMEYVKTNFPGHQALVCTHMDGHNGSGNIHVHIVINSLRKLDVPQQPFMERPIDCKAGYKHHLTKDYLKHLQQSLMNICMRENLNQVDLLSPSVNKITQQEYYAKHRGQINLDKLNTELVAEGFTPMKTKERPINVFGRFSSSRFRAVIGVSLGAGFPLYAPGNSDDESKSRPLPAVHRILPNADDVPL